METKAPNNRSSPAKAAAKSKESPQSIGDALWAARRARFKAEDAPGATWRNLPPWRPSRGPPGRGAGDSFHFGSMSLGSSGMHSAGFTSSAWANATIDSWIGRLETAALDAQAGHPGAWKRAPGDGSTQTSEGPSCWLGRLGAVAAHAEVARSRKPGTPRRTAMTRWEDWPTLGSQLSPKAVSEHAESPVLVAAGEEAMRSGSGGQSPAAGPLFSPRCSPSTSRKTLSPQHARPFLPSGYARPEEIFFHVAPNSVLESALESRARSERPPARKPVAQRRPGAAIETPAQEEADEVASWPPSLPPVPAGEPPGLQGEVPTLDELREAVQQEREAYLKQALQQAL